MSEIFLEPGIWALQHIDPKALEDAQILIGRKFNDLSLLALALTHKSCNEKHEYSNERLEYLGDILLDGAIERYLEKNFPAIHGGTFSKMRNRLRSNLLLTIMANELGLGSVLRTSGQGTERFENGGKHRNKMLADLFEAILAAIFFDGGREPLENFLERNLFKRKAKKPAMSWCLNR